jgi:hypothetical protein
MHNDTAFNLPPGISIPEPLLYRAEIDRLLLKCDERKNAILWSNYFDASNNLVFSGGPDLAKEVVWSDFKEESPYVVLQRIVCKPTEAQK